MPKRPSILTELTTLRRAALALYTQRNDPIVEKKALWEALRQALNLPKDDTEVQTRGGA